MKRAPLTIVALMGWFLFAIALMTPAPAGQSDDDIRGPGSDGQIDGGNCPADIDPPGGDGVVNVNDLLAVIGAWGPCPAGCTTHQQCDDGDPCTLDQCVGGQCQHTPIAGCCQTGNDCPAVPNATVACQGNQCVIVGCAPGFADCDGLYANGCEVNTSTNTQHCGGCNQPCSAPNAMMACVGGQCVIVGCLPGFADCDGNPANGCEVNTNTTVQHCGGCNQPCIPPGPCVIATCNNGICVFQNAPAGTVCPGGFCDGNGTCVQFP